MPVVISCCKVNFKLQTYLVCAVDHYRFKWCTRNMVLNCIVLCSLCYTPDEVEIVEEETFVCNFNQASHCCECIKISVDSII